MKATYYFQYKIKAQSNQEWLGTTGQASRTEGWNSDEEREGERALGAAHDGVVVGPASDRGAARALLG